MEDEIRKVREELAKAEQKISEKEEVCRANLFEILVKNPAGRTDEGWWTGGGYRVLTNYRNCTYAFICEMLIF